MTRKRGVAPTAPPPRDDRAEMLQYAPLMVRQLRMQSAMLAALAWQRTGVRPAGFEDIALPDPFARLVPYARAMVALTTSVAKHVR